ncbi:hypothetical protein [Polaromonas sp. P5_D5]
MIDETENLGVFMRDLLHRRDGVVLVASSSICVVFLLTNLWVASLFTAQDGLVVGKWVILWIFLPLILFFIHVRMRQLIGADSFFSVFFHACVQFGLVAFFAFKNGGIL